MSYELLVSNLVVDKFIELEPYFEIFNDMKRYSSAYGECLEYKTKCFLMDKKVCMETTFENETYRCVVFAVADSNEIKTEVFDKRLNFLGTIKNINSLKLALGL